MGTPVIVDAARTPYGKRGGELAGVHAVTLLAGAQRAHLDRTGVDPSLSGVPGPSGTTDASISRSCR